MSVGECGAWRWQTWTPGLATHQLRGLRQVLFTSQGPSLLTGTGGNEGGPEQSPGPGPWTPEVPKKQSLKLPPWPGPTRKNVGPPMGGMHPSGFAITVDGAQMPTTWWPPTSGGQCWESLSGRGQHSWDALAPVLLIQFLQQRRLC